MRRSSQDTASSASPTESADHGFGGNHSPARRRNPIAAQACETCRSRKTRCNEHRPRCGLCERLDLRCVYREPRPTNGFTRNCHHDGDERGEDDGYASTKDRTAETILAAMQRIDGKLDRVLSTQEQQQQQRPQGFEQHQPPIMPLWKEAGSGDMAVPEPMQLDSAVTGGGGSSRQQQHQRPGPAELLDDSELRGALSVFPWPAVQALLVDTDGVATSDLKGILAEGSGWLLRHEMLNGPAGALPSDTFLAGSNLHVVRANEAQSRIAFPGLKAELMEKYAHAYFGSYNLIYPVLDRHDFMTGPLPTVKRHGFAEGCLESLLALLVFALGALACEGAGGKPIAEGSGIRGGTAERPPALDIFNEARGRAGFVLGSCTVESVQAMVLMAIFYESCSKHIEHWRLTMTAAESLKAVLRIERNWDSHRIDIIRRVYWTCNVIESWYYLDLNLPRSDAVGFQDFIALPDFDDTRDFEGEPSIESKYRYGFLSMVSLRRLIHRSFDELYGRQTRADGATTADQTLIITELLRQLDVWRALLPSELRWDDAERARFDIAPPSPPSASGRRPSSVPGSTSRSVFGPSPAFGSPSAHVDVLLAQLRCRYYYARFMILRPYLWRALHAAPAALAAEPVAVVDGFVGAVDAMLQWPVAYPPVCGKKRLIPNMFAWTQSFLMFLLVLRAVKENRVLMGICEERLGRRRIEESVGVMVAWLGDLRGVDGVARWAWRTVGGLYGLDS